MSNAKLIIENQTLELPILSGSENEKAIDITKLRNTTGYITMDPGYGNTGSCISDITFVDGEKGILQYRGYPIEELAKDKSFTDVAHLLIYGNMDESEEMTNFKKGIKKHANIHEDMKRFFDGFPLSAHPMAILSSMVTALSAFNPDSESHNAEDIDLNIAKLIAKVKTLAAYSYRKSQGLPFIYPDPELNYVDNFLHMMFSDSQEEYQQNPVMSEVLNLLLI